MPTKDSLDEIHAALARVLRRRGEVDRPLTIIGPERWSRWTIGSSIAFTLRGGTYEVADRNRGGRCAVYPLPGFDPLEGAIWFSWHEDWLKLGDNRFELMGASLSFFWGTTASEKRQVLRADWDEPVHRGARAAQPHWHIDATVLMELRELVGARVQRLGIPEAPAGSLEELRDDGSPGSLITLSQSSTALQELGLARIHLGMGGWSNAPAPPQCWQRHAEPTSIVQWVDHTLALAVAEFSRIRTLDRVTI